jgi:Glycosyl hydrolase family 47
MLGGQSKQYRTMYENFIEVAREHLFFRPMTVKEEDILISGTVNAHKGSTPRLNPEQQHLTCFTGGMLAIAGKIFNRPEDFTDGAKLTDGCVWAYRNTLSGIMPETFTAVPCEDRTHCPWDSKKWFHVIDPDADEDVIRDRIKMKKLSPGFVHITDGRYLLRYVFPAFSYFKNGNPLSPSKFPTNQPQQTRSHRIRLHPLPHNRQHLLDRCRLGHVQSHPSALHHAPRPLRHRQCPRCRPRAGR